MCLKPLGQVRNCLKRFCHASKKTKLKVLFFGTDTFSVPTLCTLHKEFSDLNGTIDRIEACSSPMKTLISPVKKTCDRLSIQLHDWPPDPTLCKSFDIGVVSSFGHLIPSRIISSFPKGMLNVHGSLLPNYRGAAPIPFAIMNGDSKTGITIMEVKPFQ